ncbi:MAG: hypothetical protein GY949_12465, partial [Gammaproteobacteria bacterium]|nr:hypothetical protein [Gammaproteobacteria bacterium]
MSRKIIIHGGMPKTGTTSLQNALHALRDPLLKSQGLLYPSVGPNHSHALRTLFLNDPSEHIQYKLTGKIDTIAADQQRYRDTLRREIEGSDWQTLLFSGEGVSNMKGEEIARMHDWLGQYSDDLSLFYWVRDPVKHAVSIIQQTLKSGQVLEERFQNPPLPSWEKRLGPGREVFGANKTWIRDFDAAIRGEDGIFGAFAGDIGLTGENRQMFIDAGARDNESLSHEAALILSAINQQYPALVDGKPGPMRSAREVGLLRRIKGQKFTVPYGVLRKCHKRTRDDVVWLNET